MSAHQTWRLKWSRIKGTALTWKRYCVFYPKPETRCVCVWGRRVSLNTEKQWRGQRSCWDASCYGCYITCRSVKLRIGGGGVDLELGRSKPWCYYSLCWWKCKHSQCASLHLRQRVTGLTFTTTNDQWRRTDEDKKKKILRSKAKAKVNPFRFSSICYISVQYSWDTKIGPKIANLSEAPNLRHMEGCESLSVAFLTVFCSGNHSKAPCLVRSPPLRNSAFCNPVLMSKCPASWLVFVAC